MGCGASSSIFADSNPRFYMDGLQPFDYFRATLFPRLKMLFNSLNMTDAEAWRLFQVFLKIDTDWTGQLSIEEFCAFFEFPQTRFTDRLFGEIDEDRSGSLDFREFAMGVWNFATLDEAALARFAYELFDHDKKGFLSMAECEAMLRMIFNVSDLDSRVARVLADADENGDGRFSHEELVALVRKHPKILAPALQVQGNVRRFTFGVQYWEQATRYRNSRFEPFESIQSIARRHERIELQQVDAFMRREMERSEQLRAHALAELQEEQREEELKRWAAFGPAQRAEEEANLLLAAFRLEAEKEYKAAMVNGYTHPNDILAFCPELCGAIRRVELQLEEVLRLIPASVEEEREKGMQEARNDAWQTVKERMDRFPDLRRRLLETATAKVEEYRNTVRHGGVGFSAIAEEHFRATEGQGVAAAAFRAAQSELVDSLVEEQRSTVLARFFTIQQDKLQRVKSALRKNLKTFGIDDSGVDYETTWVREWDPADQRFFWVCPRTSMRLNTVPRPGDETDGKIAAPPSTRTGLPWSRFGPPLRGLPTSYAWVDPSVDAAYWERVEREAREKREAEERARAAAMGRLAVASPAPPEGEKMGWMGAVDGGALLALQRGGAP